MGYMLLKSRDKIGYLFDIDRLDVHCLCKELFTLHWQHMREGDVAIARLINADAVMVMDDGIAYL